MQSTSDSRYDAPVRIDIITLFPDMVNEALAHSIMARAQKAELVELVTTNPRDFTEDKHRTVDDHSYGGGPGMVLMAPPIEAALLSVGLVDSNTETPIILTDPMGKKFTQQDAHEFSKHKRIAIVCGHYEGTDERIRTKLCTHAFTIGDYVLTGGELPALVMTDAIVRLLPGVLGDPQSHQDDSHEGGLLGHPLYTKPQKFRGENVPEALLNGNHKEIAQWRRAQSLQRTRKYRPDLFVRAQLTKEDVDLLG